MNINLGVCKNTGQIFEGQPELARKLFPAPMVSACKLVTDKSQCSSGPDLSDWPSTYMFREDFYDPKSRIRRGRFYQSGTSLTEYWRVDGVNYGMTNTYHRSSIWAKFHCNGRKHIYALLGDEKRFTTWKLLDLEVIATGEEMITLKAISSFGLLPELLEKQIPSAELALIKESLDKVVDDMYTAAAESVVDCCREAATAIISAYTGHSGKDLGTVYKELANTKPAKYLAKDAANIINLFHSRRKTAEIQQGRRRITDEDAQLAVQCLGTILVELEWGRW